METMTLEQTANLAEIFGVFAIVVSLIYLTLQVRQNTRTTRLETVQAINTEFNSWLDMVASNRELAEIYHRGMFDLQSLDATQQIQFTLTISRFLRTAHELYFQWREGAIDTAFWHSWTATFADGIASTSDHTAAKGSQRVPKVLIVVEYEKPVRIDGDQPRYESSGLTDRQKGDIHASLAP